MSGRHEQTQGKSNNVRCKLLATTVSKGVHGEGKGAAQCTVGRSFLKKPFLRTFFRGHLEATFSKTRAAEKFGTPLGIRSSIVHNYYAKIISSKLNWIIANKIFSVVL